MGTSKGFDGEVHQTSSHSGLRPEATADTIHLIETLGEMANEAICMHNELRSLRRRVERMRRDAMLTGQQHQGYL